MQILFILFCNQAEKEGETLCLHCAATSSTQICCKFSSNAVTDPGEGWNWDIAALQLSSSRGLECLDWPSGIKVSWGEGGLLKTAGPVQVPDGVCKSLVLMSSVITSGRMSISELEF
ncbi:hypothetical protein WISP_85097 [Willisornis vidua]|uniref:Uncharacterized protein n=1 Tax=Willisornis vidua TaxID=1566151 RepID=A0ABQ9D664_9PASS|nr:hypothetical protein WISP_85097 [Willisornis vidua]